MKQKTKSVFNNLVRQLSTDYIIVIILQRPGYPIIILNLRQPSNFSVPLAFFCFQRQMQQIVEKKKMILAPRQYYSGSKGPS